MRRSACPVSTSPKRPALVAVSLLLLSGCSGLGHFATDTERLPGQNPNAPTGVSETVQRARGQEPVVQAMLPEPGNVWPGPPQPLPTLGDVAHGSLSGGLLGAGQLPRGGSMSMGEQDAVRGGVPIEQGFGGGGLSESVPDPATHFHTGGAGASMPNLGNAGGGSGSGGGTGNIVIPNGDGTSTVISPDGSVKTVKGVPK